MMKIEERNPDEIITEKNVDDPAGGQCRQEKRTMIGTNRQSMK